MRDWTTAELQKLVLLAGSKKAFAIHLGLDTQQAAELWAKHGLKKPLPWLRGQPELERLRLLGKAGSLKELAKRLACSEAALRLIYTEPAKELDWDVEKLAEQLDRYGSVRLTAHMNDTTESAIRRAAERTGVTARDLTYYDTTDHSNGKGRRAELDYAQLRGDRVTADRNKLDGPHAAYDFDDEDFGRVNVKSSRQHKFKARTRADSPEFWKVSNRGWATADNLVCMCYDRHMEKLIGFCVVPGAGAKHSSSLTLRKEQLRKPEELQTSSTPDTASAADVT